MAGVLDETHYGEVRENFESDQSQLSTFSGEEPTTIAVVRRPRDTRIDDYCDEWMPALGMPDEHLERFWAYRQGYRTNSAVEQPTVRAYKDANLAYHYQRHLRNSDEAQKAIDEIVRRLGDGEDITIVCFEESPLPCHRHYVKKVIEARLSSDYDFSENKKLTA